MSDDPFQLDLTSTITDVPQANSLPLFIRLMERIERGTSSVDALAETLEIEERTVHYYLDFGRWLGFLQPVHQGEVGFTETGLAFATSIPGRKRLFSQAMFRKELVQTINALKRDSIDESGVPTLDTRDAAEKAIAGMTKLAPSTAGRRASGLAQMLEAAYRASRIDWNTGEPLTEYRNITFDFDGRTFLTAMAARQFTASREFRIGCPRQVLRFLEKKGHGLNARMWKRASYDSADGRASWYGSLPVNETTLEIAERGGRDLRKLVTICVPFVTLAAAILTTRDTLKRPSVRLTHDMYGLKLWEHERELGPPIRVIERLADELGLKAVKGVPKALSHADPDLVEQCTDHELIEIMLTARLIREGDTTYELVSGVEDEYREGSDTSPSIMERMKPIHDVFRKMLVTRVFDERDVD